MVARDAGAVAGRPAPWSAGLRRVVREGRRAATALLTLVLVLTTTGWVTAEHRPGAGASPRPIGAEAWERDTSVPGGLPPLDAPPAAVGDFFAGLPLPRQRALAERYPGVVGNLPGVPLELRTVANELAIRATRRQAERTASDGSASATERRQAAELAERCAALLADGRRYLAFDPRGRGLVAEVLGDPESAEHLTVLVPGNDTDLASYVADARAGRRGLAADARALHAEQRRLAPAAGVAVVAWAGYLTPDGLGADAATGTLARAGAARLEREVAGLLAARQGAAGGAERPVHLTAICHSYGAVVCGLAAGRLDGVDDIVAVAAPGMRADTVAGLGTDARVWAMRSADDWIRLVPHLRLGDLGHGADPMADAFGARRLSSAGAEGHDGYAAPGGVALTNLALVAVGQGARTTAPGFPATAQGNPATAQGSPATAQGNPATAQGSPATAQGSPAAAPGSDAEDRATRARTALAHPPRAERATAGAGARARDHARSTENFTTPAHAWRAPSLTVVDR
ncbi:alpha/beta hydrolase [Allostreptomyces psammosilenae]|uniref:DUF1023 domain-containing protein n=1 Tax=Allostreptomyces psammosilenae TaxID=1892865 RepID=A0A852ZZC7_9ACTN|nr:alpha/beta hydrolase [Allostreptomyces psammosilenae]NYI07733.1 hypothetical protein [Allostreptomyces psammosilenae]